MVESTQQEQHRYKQRATLAPVNRLPKQLRNVLCTGVPLAARVGLVRLLLKTSQPPRNIPPGFTAEQAATFQGLELQPKSFVAAPVCNFEIKSPAKTRAPRNLRSCPPH